MQSIAVCNADYARARTAELVSAFTLLVQVALDLGLLGLKRRNLVERLHTAFARMRACCVRASMHAGVWAAEHAHV